jgi:hypothetical protein
MRGYRQAARRIGESTAEAPLQTAHPDAVTEALYRGYTLKSASGAVLSPAQHLQG